MVVSCYNESDCENLYDWLNSLEFSRQKKNLSRDFSDGVLVAEILKRYYPRLVERHNYNPANSLSAKMENWLTLDRKVLSHLGLRESKDFYSELAACNPKKMESFLLKIKLKIDNDLEQKSKLLNPDEIEEESIPSPEEFSNLMENLKLKEDEMMLLNHRVKHLESLLDLKEQRIQDLMYQNNNCKCTNFQ